jgi:mannose-6-phosphate isomerase
MLLGFREPADMAAALAGHPELAPLAARLAGLRAAAGATAAPDRVVRALYEHLMTLPQDAVDAMLAPLVARLAPAYRDDRLDRGSPDFWAARAAEHFALPGGHHDRGILSIYLMNLVRLDPGQGTYLGAGRLHAYLEGIAVEIMANSDNVIRGGLTPKHVDVAELLRILRFEPERPVPLTARPVGPAERRYTTPAEEFGLARLDLPAVSSTPLHPTGGPELLVVLEGEVRLRWDDESMQLRRGAAVFVPPSIACGIDAAAPALLFRAFVP